MAKKRMVAVGILMAVAMLILAFYVIKSAHAHDNGYNALTDPYSESPVRGPEWFRLMAEQIDELDERMRVDSVISLHRMGFWEEPEEGSNWIKDTNYRVSLPLPDSFMQDGHMIVIHVDYPDILMKGEEGTITITAKDENGDVCTGKYMFTAADELSLSHGEYSEFHGCIIGDGMDLNYYLNAIVITFCTSADKSTEDLPDDLAGRTGACPTTTVLYHRHPNLG